MLLVVPMLENSGGGAVLLRVGITLVLIGAVISTQRRLPLLIGGLLIVAIVSPMLWLTMLFDTTALFIAGCVLDSAFFVTTYLLKKPLERNNYNVK